MNLPPQLQQQVEKWASLQGIDPEQFVVWAVSEKLDALNLPLEDPAFPGVNVQQGASGILTPVLQGTGIRIQTIAIAAHHWQLPVSEIAIEYGISQPDVELALAYYEAHSAQVEAAIAAEQALEEARG